MNQLFLAVKNLKPVFARFIYRGFNFKIFVLVFSGIFLNLLFIIPSIKWGCEGTTKCGLWIGEWHYHDALWHIAVSRISFHHFPPAFPSASGHVITSYNYLLGLLLYLFERVSINSFISYFYILPIASNALFALSLLRYLKETKKTITQSIWVIFFSYFCGSFAYFLIFYRHNISDFTVLAGFPVATTIQPSTVLSNIQFHISISIFLYFLTNILTRNWSKNTQIFQLFALSMCIGLKLYTSIFILMTVTFGSIYWFVCERKFVHLLRLLPIYMISIISYLLFYLPINSYIDGIPFVYAPLALPHVLTESGNLFYHSNFTLGRYYLIGLGKISPRLIAYEITSALIFIVVNLGTRTIFPIYFLLKKTNMESLLLLLVTCVGIIIPIFFIQKGGGWYNTMQFAYLSIYSSGILAGLTVDRLSKLKNRFFILPFIIFIVITSVPTTLLSLKFITKEKMFISDAQLAALSYLQRLPEGVVLSLPDYKNSSYVPALTGKVSYLIDDEVSALLNLPVQQKRIRIDKRDCGILREIDYIYLNNQHGQEFTKCLETIKYFKLTYKNQGVSIYSKSKSLP